MKLVKLIIRKIIVKVTRCHILKLKCLQIRFLIQTPLAELTALPHFRQLDLRGLLLNEVNGGRAGGKGKGGG